MRAGDSEENQTQVEGPSASTGWKMRVQDKEQRQQKGAQDIMGGPPAI